MGKLKENKETKPKIIFWSEVDGKQVLTQYVEKSLNAIQDPKKLKALLNQHQRFKKMYHSHVHNALTIILLIFLVHSLFSHKPLA
jgi:hypothetical protein